MIHRNPLLAPLALSTPPALRLHRCNGIIRNSAGTYRLDEGDLVISVKEAKDQATALTYFDDITRNALAYQLSTSLRHPQRPTPPSKTTADAPSKASKPASPHDSSPSPPESGTTGSPARPANAP